jgi:NitT/TauT family transport system permease protein
MSTRPTAAPAATNTRPRWSALPQRRPPRPRPEIAKLRVPISTRARVIITTISVVGPVAVWWLLTLVVDPRYLPTPVHAVTAAVDMATSGPLLDDAWATTKRVLQAFGLAVLASVPIGLWMGSFRSVWTLFEPAFGLLRYLPAPAFVPLLIGWLGIGEEPKIALIFIATFFFNALMTADVVRGVPANLIDVSYTLGARTGEIIRKVIVPYSMPGMIDAIRVNAAAAFGAVVVAELVAADSGLGYRINRLARFGNYDDIFGVLIVIALIGVILDVALRLTRDRIGRWI